MTKALKIITCGIVAVSLSGCQSFLSDIGLAKRGTSDASASNSRAESRVELGRAALKAGAPANAIYHFERAILDPEQAPDAYNGMGVAYAQLGRQDLAKRFFNAALMLRPNDARISRNLARLYSSDDVGNGPAFATADTQSAVARAEADAFAQRFLAPESDDNDRGPIRIDLRRSAMERASSDELLINGAKPAIKNEQASDAVPPVVGKAKPANRSEAMVDQAEAKRIEVAANTAEGTFGLDFGMDFCLAKEKPAGEQQKSYPIRVTLAKVAD